MTWMLLTMGRFPTSTLMSGKYNAAAVAMRTIMSTVMLRCTQRSAREKRAMRVSGDGLVVASIGRSHPRVDVVAADLPITGDHFIDHLDARHPLE